MENKIFKTIVRADHKFGDSDYVRGRISGIQLAMCAKDPKKEFVWSYVPRVGDMMKTECTSEQYDAFIKIIEELYPGLCIFDYKE